jgi:integrase
VDGQPLPPTPANVKYARRVATEIGDKIRAGNFKYEDYFPDSRHGLAEDASEAQAPLLFDVFDKWLRVHELKPSTRSQYRTRINSFWKAQLTNVPVDQVRHSDILEALTAGTWKSAKSRNNELSMIRGPFELAKRDKHISENPCDGIEPKEVQQPSPDPFSQDEVGEILAHLANHRPAQILNFVQLMFDSGLRTSEGIGLRWENIDFRAREMLIEGGNVYDEETDTTKTSKARVVLLSAMPCSASRHTLSSMASTCSTTRTRERRGSTRRSPTCAASGRSRSSSWASATAGLTTCATPTPRSGS